MTFIHFFKKKKLNIISKLNDDFSEDFFEVLHISVGPKIKILVSSACIANYRLLPDKMVSKLSYVDFLAGTVS